MYENCSLCGFKCNVNRNQKSGVCKCGVYPKLALVSKHMWEEPCISGKEGSRNYIF